MEQSKSVSIILAKLKIAYPYYFKELSDEDFIGLIGMYQDYLSEYNEITLNNAVKSIIKKNKFMPTIKEIIDECESLKSYKKNFIIELMYKDGYFKRGVCGELPNEHATRNYEKALIWLEKGIIPKWFLEEMKTYGYIDENHLLNSDSFKLLDMKE